MRESHCLDTDLKHRRDFGGNRTRICDRRSSLLATSVADDETDITYTRRVLDFCKTNEDEQCNNQKLSKGKEQMTHTQTKTTAVEGKRITISNITSSGRSSLVSSQSPVSQFRGFSSVYSCSVKTSRNCFLCGPTTSTVNAAKERNCHEVNNQYIQSEFHSNTKVF